VDLTNIDEMFTGAELEGTDFIAAFVLITVGFGISYLIGRWRRRRLGRPDGHSQQLIALLARVAQILVLAVFFGWALTRLGADIGWLTLMVIVALLIVVLAARPVLEGLGASAALATRPVFSVGDEIGVDDIVGEVIEVGTRSTAIRRRDGRLVHIPNVGMLSKTITVYTVDGDRRSAVEVTVDFRTDIDHAEAVIRRALEDVDTISRLGSVRSRMTPEGVLLSIRFWHPSGIQEGNDAADDAVRVIRITLQDEGIGFTPPADIAIVKGPRGPDAVDPAS
jgi:small-conductance mechanosensitive channel